MWRELIGISPPPQKKTEVEGLEYPENLLSPEWEEEATVLFGVGPIYPI